MIDDEYRDQYILWKRKHEAYGVPGYDNHFSESLLTPDNFMKYYYNGEKYTDNGAVVVFTGKQYISVINANDGQQGHMHTYGRIYNAMNGIYSDITFAESARLMGYVEKKYPSLTFEAENKLSYKCIRMYFNDSISSEEFASFETFYNQFADIIRNLGFRIWVSNQKGDKEDINVHNNIDELRDFLKSKISSDKVSYELPGGEQIVGVSNNYTRNKSR